MAVRDVGHGPRGVDPGGPGTGLSAEDDGAACPDVRAGGEGWGERPAGFEIRGGAVWHTREESHPEARAKDDGMICLLGRCCPPWLSRGVFDGPELDDVVRF